MQTQTSNALHNAIMKAGSKDRPPMLASGNYVQWKSIIKKYIDTKPNHELIHYSLQNPPYKYTWADKEVPVTEGSPETTTVRYMENYNNVSQNLRNQLNAEAEAKAIERLKQGESINVQDLETNLYWEFGKFTSRDGESLESYYSRFYKMMNELVKNQCDSQELKTVSYHKLYDFLKQHQNEVNEIRVERLARTANSLALVAQQQPVYHPQNHPAYYTQNSSTRSQLAATRNKGKAIVNSPLPINDQKPSMVDEDDNMSKDKEIDKLVALISLSGTGYDNQRLVNVVGARENVARECQKPKRANDASYHKEKMLLCKQEEAGFQLNAEQVDWKDDTDDEPEDQELEAHYLYMAKLQKQSKSVHDTYPSEQDEHNVIIDSLDMHYDRDQIDQDDDADDLDNERDLLASLIEKLKCEIDDNKNRNKILETSNKVLVEKLKGDLISYKMESQKSFNAYTQKINDLNQMISEMKKELFAHQKTISILSQQKEAQIKLYKSRKDKEFDEVIALENKVKVLDNILYTTGQSVQTMNMLNRNCKTSFAKPKFFKKAQRANPRLQHGRMILESFEHSPLPWPTVEEDGVTRLKKYSELSAAEAVQADCDVKATNIILQGLPLEERECKLYDEFDKFAYRKGKTLRDFYLRFSLLLNDMNMYNMKLKQFQVNMKFLNTLPPEWSKFVTDVKLVRDLYTTNVDQLHAYLGQHEYHANEVRLMHERNLDPFALVSQHQLNRPTYQHHQQSYHQPQFQQQASTYQTSPYATSYHTRQYVSQAPSSSNLSISYPLNDMSSTINFNAYMTSSLIPRIDYAPTVH
uniref:Integrase, catalytic region, zinc finger, CCHC-type, peptidase aspartic, catalytic n=1 Tax=Tanacetum cinerariifolium TaxID=118510 RepID=A0A699HBS5_TANCI|nr:hypothetical protein [Tanacetum cinerariifolium]